MYLPLFLVKDYHPVRPRERVQVGEVRACERKTHNVDESLGVLGHHAVLGGQDCVIEIAALA